MKRVKIILDKLFQRIDENLIKSTERFLYMKSFFEKMVFNIQSSVILSNKLEQFEVSNIIQEGD